MLVEVARRIEVVHDALEHARAKWSSWFVGVSSFFGAAPKDQVLSALRQIEQLGVEPWSKRGMSLSPTDQAKLDAWTREGDDILTNIATTAEDAKTASITTIVADTVIATAKDTAKVAKQVADKAVESVTWFAKNGWWIAGTIVVVIVFIIIGKFKR